MRAWPLFILCASLVACTQFPEVDASIPPAVQAADYPTLLPLDLTLADSSEIDTEATQNALNARVASLRARASALRARSID